MSNKSILNRRTALIIGAGAGLSACLPAPNYVGIDQQARQIRAQLYQSNPNVKGVANNAAGYLVFPKILKAGFFVGASSGDGALFVKENIVGHYNVTAASAGFQAGAQSFSMILFFMTSEALARFRQSRGFEIGTDIEYAIPQGGMSIGASTATYNKPIYALIFNQAGVMAGASLEGAKYSAI